MVLTSTDLLLTELSELSRSTSTESMLVERYELQIRELNSGQFVELNSREFGMFLLESFESNEAPASLQRSQRWAIKQESAKDIGKWRHSKLASPEWHKLALTWPVDENERPIDEFEWPINGALIAGAPPLLDLDRPTESANIRFRVIKNGTTTIATTADDSEDSFPGAVYVCKLDSKHLIREFVHCSKISYRQFEFNTFLDSCTQALGLRSAARRIFDQKGVELFDLSGLKQDQLLYVSTGEAWQNPRLVRDEMDKKTIMTGLSEDLGKVAYFNRLKEPLLVNDPTLAPQQRRRLVVEACNSSLSEGVRLVIGKCCLTDEHVEKIKSGQSMQYVLSIAVGVDASWDNNDGQTNKIK